MLQFDLNTPNTAIYDKLRKQYYTDTNTAKACDAELSRQVDTSGSGNLLDGITFWVVNIAFDKLFFSGKTDMAVSVEQQTSWCQQQVTYLQDNGFTGAIIPPYFPTHW